MLNRLLIAAASAGGFAAGEAAANPRAASISGPLPDFPREARAGECWARIPMGSLANATPGSQAVWTLQRGSGPGAIWSYSERPGPAAPLAVGALDWAQVDCATGQPIRFADAPPPAPPSDIYAEAPLPAAPPPPYPAPEFAPAPFTPPAPHAFAPPAFSGQGPYAEGGFPPAPPHHAPGTAPYGHPHHPPAHAHSAPHAGPMFRQPVAPWFGGRTLNWPGKTLR